MSRRRAFVAAFVLVLVGALFSSTTAGAEYRGTDMWSNLMPDGAGGLADRYPLNHYQLDYYVDGPSVGLSGVQTDGTVPMIAQFFASWLFLFAVMIMRCVISIFQWAFDVDLVTGAAGGLASSDVVAHQNYENIVKPLMVTALLCLVIWIVFKAVKRDRSDLGSALIRVVALSVVAITITWNSQETIGRAYQLGDDLAVSIINTGDSKQSVSDRMFETFIYRPWAVLQFGGLEVCTGSKVDSDGYPLAANSVNPAKTCHSALKKDSDDHGDYARRFVRYAPGTDERKAEYDARREGKAPDDKQSQFVGIKIDRTDAPAVDMMQAGGAVQRLCFVVLVLAGMAGGILLLGLIAIVMLFAQIALLLLFQLVPFLILASAYPPAHGIVTKALKMIGKALIGKAIYALLLAITFSTSSAIMTLGGNGKGYFLAFGLQALLFLGVFFKRKAILEMATSSKTAQHYSEHENKTTAFAAGAATASLGALGVGASEFASTMRRGWRSDHTDSSQHHADRVQGDHRRPDSTSPPASAGRDYSPSPSQNHEPLRSGQTNSTDVPSTTLATMQSRGATNEEEKMPTRSFSQDLNDARARNYDRENSPEKSNRVPVDSEAHPPPLINGIASASTFRRDLGQERHERDLAQRE